MKSSVFMAVLCLGVFASGAFAAEWSVKGNLTESVDASDNYFLSNEPKGPTLKSNNLLHLDVLAKTPITTYAWNTDYTYYKYLGPGAAEANPTWGMPAKTVFNVDTGDKFTKYHFATWSERADIASTQLAQTGTVSAHGTINTYGVDGTVTRQINALDSISWETRALRLHLPDRSRHLMLT